MIQLTVSALVGAVLLAAGSAKLRDPDGFARTVSSYDLVPWSASRLLGRWLPRVEVVVGAVLVLGVAPTVAGGVAVLLFTAFSAALGVNRLRGRTELSCGCFGSSAGPTRLTAPVLARPVVLAVLAAVVAAGALGGPVDPGPGERLVAAAAGVLPVAGLRALAAVRSLGSPVPPPPAGPSMAATRR